MKRLINKFKTARLIAATGLILLGAGGTALAASQNSSSLSGTQQFEAVLTPLNGTHAYGVATATIDVNGMAHFHITVTGLINAPHAQHVHFGVAAAHECPTLTDDTNGDGVISTTEGGPKYGPVQTSLTTSGDTSAASTLAITRYPTYANNAQYDRTFQLTADQAQEIRSGLSAVVIHGIDTIIPDGKYDGPPSELDPSLPQEATAPATCGILHEVFPAAYINSNGTLSNTSYSTKTMTYVAMGFGIVALAVAIASFGRRKV